MWNYVESLTQGKHQSSETALLSLSRSKKFALCTHF
jgi:hypothetical protein